MGRTAMKRFRAAVSHIMPRRTKARSHLMPLRRKARKGKESLDAPARKKGREGEESPDAPAPDAAAALHKDRMPLAPPQSRRPHRLKSSRPRDRGLLWRTAHRSAGMPGPQPLLPGAGCVGKRGKLSQNCSNWCDGVCSLKCIHLHKRALSSSLSQYSAARPASERYRAAAHTGYSHAALAGASNDQAAMSVPKRVGHYSENLTLVTLATGGTRRRGDYTK